MIPSQPSNLSRFQYPRNWVHPRLQCSLRYMVQNVAFNHVVDERATISSVDRSWRFSCEETLLLSFSEDMRTWWILSNMDSHVSQPTMKGPVVWLPKNCFPLTTNFKPMPSTSVTFHSYPKKTKGTNLSSNPKNERKKTILSIRLGCKPFIPGTNLLKKTHQYLTVNMYPTDTDHRKTDHRPGFLAKIVLRISLPA